MSYQRRKTHRIRPGVAVRFFGEPIDRTKRQYLDGVVENCGLGGMFISTDRPFPKGSLVTLEFRIKSESRDLDPVKAQGIVRWVRRRTGDRGMGIAFIEFEGLGDRVFSDWIKKVLDEPQYGDENKPKVYLKIAALARRLSPQTSLSNMIAG